MIFGHKSVVFSTMYEHSLSERNALHIFPTKVTKPAEDKKLNKVKIPQTN